MREFWIGSSTRTCESGPTSRLHLIPGLDIKNKPVKKQARETKDAVAGDYTSNTQSVRIFAAIVSPVVLDQCYIPVRLKLLESIPTPEAVDVSMNTRLPP